MKGKGAYLGCNMDKISGQSFRRTKYLMGPYNAGPKSALFLRVAEIRAGVKKAGVKRAVFFVKELKKTALILKSLFREKLCIKMEILSPDPKIQQTLAN